MPWRAVRLESVTPDIPAKGLFLHIENVQPRVGEPAVPPVGREANDLIAPDPGFTAAQYKRLALIYIAASVRRGEWLIPGFHAVIDSGISGAHDDPQNFDRGMGKRSGRVIREVTANDLRPSGSRAPSGKTMPAIAGISEARGEWRTTANKSMGAPGRTRTSTPSALDFESSASTNSTQGPERGYSA